MVIAEMDAAGLTDGELENNEEFVADAENEDFPFGDNVKTDEASLRAWLGEENEPENVGNIAQGETEQAQAIPERSTQARGTAQEIQVISEKDIPKDLVIEITTDNGKERVNAFKAMVAANQEVNRFTALRACL